MGHENNIYEKFLNHPDAKALFAKLDYVLRDGVHIQNYSGQSSLFRFIQENEDSLKSYYAHFYEVNLECGGEDTMKYYYMDFTPQSRGNIVADHRYFIPNEFVIVGFLIYKLIFIDGNLELNSVKQLQKMIRQEYEELKPNIYRVLAKIRKEKINQMDEEKVDKIVTDALTEFNKISWITMQDDYFDTLPSFHRLVKIYGDYINNIDEWLKQENPL